VNNPKILIINISTFLTRVPFGSEEYYNYDLREPKRKIIHPDKIKETKRTVVSTQDWTNIPYYPTTLEKKENMVKYLTSMGKPVPHSLLHQIAEGRKNVVKNDSFNNFQGAPNNNEAPPRPPQQVIQRAQQQAPHKYSQQYASYVGAKPRAQASARIGMGGSY
jgi:hypothetical protein